MSKRVKKLEAARILIDDGLAVLGHLSQHGLLTTNRPEPILQKETAGKVTTGGDNGDSTRPGQYTGL